MSTGSLVPGPEQVGVERLCVFDLPPVEFVNLVADLDCRWLATGLQPFGAFNAAGYPAWSLRANSADRRDMIAAMADRNVRMLLGEGFLVGKRPNDGDWVELLDIFSELGCPRINVTSSGRDYEVSRDGFTALSDLAATYDVEVVLEVGSGPNADVRTAARMVSEVGRPNLKLLIDTMHFFRFGSTLEDLAAIDPALIGHVQLADVPRESRYDTYMEEAMFARLPPGEGELPLADLLRLIPADVIVGLEIPQRDRLIAGEAPIDVVRSSVSAARALLTQLQA